MEMIQNKVAESGIITLDLAVFLPDEKEIVFFDLKPFLFKELILKEKDYRESLKNHDWTAYNGRHVALGCSTDAIIPVWAYMLATSALAQSASVYYGTAADVSQLLITRNIAEIDETSYQGKRVILKGCGDVPVPESAYVAATRKLLPVVKSLMYGEPCSTVPVYKQPKTPVAAAAS